VSRQRSLLHKSQVNVKVLGGKSTGLHLHPGARCDSEKDDALGGQRKSAHHDRFRRRALCSNHSLSGKSKVAALRNRNTPRSSRSIPKIPGARTLIFFGSMDWILPSEMSGNQQSQQQDQKCAWYYQTP
jgi:hypothetical protein